MFSCIGNAAQFWRRNTDTSFAASLRKQFASSDHLKRIVLTIKDCLNYILLIQGKWVWGSSKNRLTHPYPVEQGYLNNNEAWVNKAHAPFLGIKGYFEGTDSSILFRLYLKWICWNNDLILAQDLSAINQVLESWRSICNKHALWRDGQNNSFPSVKWMLFFLQNVLPNSNSVKIRRTIRWMVTLETGIRTTNPNFILSNSPGL